MRTIRVFAAVLVVLAIGLAAAGWVGDAWYKAPGPTSSPTTLIFEHGENLHTIADKLADAGVLLHPLWFVAAAELTRGAGEVKAGEYAIPAAASPAAVLALIRSGKTVVHRLVIPEGLSTLETLALVDAAEGLTGTVTDPPAEGELAPQTYFYAYGDHRQALIDRMKSGMSRLVEELWAARRPDVALASPAQAVTLASIVEKETALANERPKIAGVFYNRLRLGMKLQSDPTVVYAINHGAGPLGHRLDKDDLAVDSPYNTYRIDGLPPGPIDNPGRASLAAVLAPDETDALYFVADGSGGHAFSTTLESHHQNVEHWRKLQGKPKP